MEVIVKSFADIHAMGLTRGETHPNDATTYAVICLVNDKLVHAVPNPNSPRNTDTYKGDVQFDTVEEALAAADTFLQGTQAWTISNWCTDRDQLLTTKGSFEEAVADLKARKLDKASHPDYYRTEANLVDVAYLYQVNDGYTLCPNRNSIYFVQCWPL